MFMSFSSLMLFLLGITLVPHALPALFDYLLFRTHLREDKPDHLRRRPRRKPPWSRSNDVYVTEPLWLQALVFLLMMVTIPWHYSRRKRSLPSLQEPDNSLSAAFPGCQPIPMRKPSLEPTLVPNLDPGRPHLPTLHRLRRLNQCTAQLCNLIDRKQRFRNRPLIHALRMRMRSHLSVQNPVHISSAHEGGMDRDLDLRCDPRYLQLRPKSFFTRLFSLNSTSENEGDTMVFDTDSIQFAIDPCATATIVNYKDHLTNLRPVTNSFLSGVGGKIPVVAVGTLTWRIEDDLGQTHRLRVKNAFYVPQSPLNLLCPQQWAAQRTEIHGVEDEPHFRTNATYSLLTWNGGQSTLTVPHDASNNLPLWRTAPGFHQAAAFICKEVGQAFPATVIPDDDDSDDEMANIHDDETVQASNNTHPTPFPFDVSPDTNEHAVIVDDPTLPEDSQMLLD